MAIAVNEDLEYYVLDSGKVWSIAQADFVSAPTAVELMQEDDKRWSKAPGPDRKCDEAALRDALLFYSLPLGTLATDEDLAKEAREKRNALISETDYLAMPDYPMDEEKKAAVLAYRQALRDIPEQVDFPRQIDWPVKP